MKLSYKQRIFSYFFVIFAIFAICIVVFEQKQEIKYKNHTLEAKLDSYTELINRYLVANKITDSTAIEVKQLVAVMPEDIRVTLISTEGDVLYDNNLHDLSHFDNHLSRPEIMMAKYQSHGTNIRMSNSTKHEYLYYAKSYPSYYVRVALPYTIYTQNTLKADNAFLYLVLILFVGVLILLNYAAGRFGKSITQLKKLSTAIKEEQKIPQQLTFPNDELGEIGKQLVEILHQKEKSKQDIMQERAKMIQHFQYAGEGLGIFSRKWKKIYTNTHFIQYLNLLVGKPTFDVDCIFAQKQFAPIHEFLKTKNKENPFFAHTLNKDGKIFLIQVVVFDDKSFEITIKDISKAEKTRLLKQEMTNSIAHELRTPVTSLRGYLETLNEKELEADKKALFIARAYRQVIRLSSLLEDVSLISKIEEAPKQFEIKQVDIQALVNDIRIDRADKLSYNKVEFVSSLSPNLVINGSYTLLYSVFSNLIDNSISYAGEGFAIHIDNYLEDIDYLYFSYYDTGTGVEKQHLGRLFERFYRVNEGRSRDTGGSGLGLSIVKNAILLHKGEIQAKTHEGGGLQFLFTLKK